MHKVTYFEFTDNMSISFSSKKSPSNSNHIESINEYSSLSRDNIRPFPCEYSVTAQMTLLSFLLLYNKTPQVQTKRN